MNDRAFQKGDRVRFSHKGREVYSRSPHQRLGTIASNPIRPSHVCVRWDELKSISGYDYRLLERVSH